MSPRPRSDATRPPLDRAAVHRDLAARDAALRARIGTLAEAPELGAAQGFGKRIGDGTTEAIGRLTEIGVGESLELEQQRVGRALEKLDEGSYGTCDRCGNPIAPRRLQALPESTLCIACAGLLRR